MLMRHGHEVSLDEDLEDEVRRLTGGLGFRLVMLALNSLFLSVDVAIRSNDDRDVAVFLRFTLSTRTPSMVWDDGLKAVVSR